jgi:hypothetical protein
MSVLKKDHVLEAGAGAVAGGATGAVIGAVVAGPVGLTVGAVAGGALGAVFGDRAAEAADKRDDLGHFEQIFREMPYYVDGMGWDDYAPAYRYGLETFRTHGARALAETEGELASGWGRARDGSRLDWPQARPAVEHAWRELNDTLQARGA